jgi:hypothetical protein
MSAPAYLAENPHAGQGPVMLEIGFDTGALIVSAPVQLADREIEIHRFGRSHRYEHRPHHEHGPDHEHGSSHQHGHHHAHAPHVAVITRPLPNGELITCGVFPDLQPGAYTLKLMPSGPSMPVVVRAGQVTTVEWLPPAD